MIGRTKALTMPSRSAAAINVSVELNAMPDTIFEASQRPIPTTTARMRNPSMTPALLFSRPI